MDMEVVLFSVALSIGVGYWANGWGRDGFRWGAISLIISPLIAAIILVLMGKTLDKKAEEAAAFENLVKSKKDT